MKLIAKTSMSNLLGNVGEERACQLLKIFTNSGVGYMPRVRTADVPDGRPPRPADPVPVLEQSFALGHPSRLG